MSQQQPTASRHTERASNTPSKLVPRASASGEGDSNIKPRLPIVVQPKPLSAIVESSTSGVSQRHSQQERSGLPVQTENSQPARPAITVTEPSTPTMNPERGERGTERGRQPAPSNRLNTVTGPVDRRPSTRQDQGNSRHEQSLYPAEANTVRPSMQHTTNSESTRRREASYYAEEEELDQGSYYEQTAGQPSRTLAQTEQSLGRSRRYSPRRTSPPLPTVEAPQRSGSRSPPLSERLTVFHKPISVVPGQPSNIPPAEILSTRDADSICDDLVRKVKIAQLGKMYDRAVEADRRGLVDDGLYDMVLDFFYRFLPMVFANGERCVPTLLPAHLSFPTLLSFRVSNQRELGFLLTVLI